ncbi:hypothetical protein PAHAL_8G227100 [Panicum hallii]|uniref:F-box domain-containing protein n=1 Tax=Panicum hallii TaxID=206008 RepID=A0A2S3IF27_9POAL|nr:MEIOTIC F-BOX protein MOF-like [Panicum hallii]PAN43294.1 hypothetical protein PAHAL_8G227100 [Panicum hallii]
MEPAEAARKRASPRRPRGGGGPDRLSALPDCLLHVIMSSLKARQAVQTCVLSRRWRDLWRSVPCLDVDIDEFRANTAAPDFDHDAGSGGNSIPDSSDDSSSSDYSSSSWESDDSSDSGLGFDSSSSSDDDDDGNIKEWVEFEDFTANLMSRCNIAELDSFRLHIGSRWAPPFCCLQAQGWLRRAMKYCNPDPASPRKGLSPSPWRLKRLHLCHMFLGDGFAKHVSSVCRNLEDLELHDCKCQIQSVTSDSLKTLVLKNCSWHNLSEIALPTLKTLVIDGGENISHCVLVILTPAVASLHLAVRVDHFYGGISTNQMPSLVKASIHLQGHRYSLPNNKLGGDQFKLLCSISNATSLELSGVGKRVLGKKPTFQEFMNLRNLLLDECDLRNDFRTLGFFLQSSPNLEKLTLRHCKFPNYPKKKKGEPKLNKTSSSEFRGLDFMCENLKVEIICSNSDARELVKVLLHASGNLSMKNIKFTIVN